MNFTILVATPFVLYALAHGCKLALTVIGIFCRRPIMGMLFSGVAFAGYSGMPSEVRAEVDELVSAPAALHDLIGDLSGIVEEGNSLAASSAAYADDELAEFYVQENDRYAGTFERILWRLVDTFGDYGGAVAMEDGWDDAWDDYSPGDV
jgi:hypothetical protein